MKRFNRINLFGVIFSVIAMLIIFQMLRIQLFVSGKPLREDLETRLSDVSISLDPERGGIYDRWGHQLAGNRKVYEIGVDLVQIRDGTRDAKVIAEEVSKVLDIDYYEVLKIVETPWATTSQYLIIADFIEPEKISSLDEIKRDYDDNPEKYILADEKVSPNLDALHWSPHLLRTYPETTLGFNILGFYRFLDREKGTPVYGIEEFYDDLLAGTPSEFVISRDIEKTNGLPYIPPGASLYLTIDREIQSMTEEILTNAVNANKAESGTAIIMDPSNGEILALAIAPQMDINLYWEAYPKIKESRTYNRAIDVTYEPGSIFKVLTMAAALDSGSVVPETQFLDTGSIEVGGYHIYNWDRSAWGPQDMQGCMQHSLNVCLAWIATEKLGAKDFYDYMDAFGIGHRSNVDLAGEKFTPLSIPGDSGWYPVNLGTNSFGQGVAVAPIQMISAVSAVANGGEIMAPHILKSVVTEDQRIDIPARVIGTPITAETAETLTQMLAVSLESEASTALVDGYTVAGKTGTAEIPGPNGYETELTNASFIGWGPTDNPRFVVFVWIEKPESSPWGSIVAAPIFSNIVRELVILMDIPPDHIRNELASQ
ncbi:MAG: penicillin-binding protein 2 [Anaerolineaceae bacterium]|nr:penicillin-binding protein 2 [Anaerolineaceae bacterium]